MTGDRSINISGGTYNEYIQGDAVNVQGNYINQGASINLNQDLSQIATQIQQRLIQLQAQGDSLEVAQCKVASQLADQAKKQPETKHQLANVGKSIGNSAVSGIIGEVAVTVLKMALGLVGISF